MVKSFPRPRNKTELEHREVAGLWKAIALVRKIGESNDRLSLETILGIHKTMLASAFPEIAGRFRRDGEDILKLKCVEPPPGRQVQERMYAMWRECDIRLAQIPRTAQALSKAKRKQWRAAVIDAAAWIQHQIGAIHPFCDGNGRMARLLTNLVLHRYGFPPSEVRYEGEDKDRYLGALCRIDQHGDYDMLKQLVISGVLEAYKKEQELRKRQRAS